ncbi:MAG: SPFH domain-containing protein [Anaerolineae bacterium]
MKNYAILIAALALAAILFLVPARITLEISVLVLALGVILFARTRERDARLKWYFIALSVVIAGVVASVYFSATQPEAGSADYLTRLFAKGWALAVGGAASAVVTGLFLFFVLYTSAIELLASNTDEGVTVWQALKLHFSLVFGINYDWIVISEGKIIKTKPKGALKELGGPGRVIVTPGNAVIMQKGSGITRVCGAGTFLSRKKEKPAHIFDLKPQFAVHMLEDVVTKDQIPLKIELGVGYQIARAKDPSAAKLLEDNSGIYNIAEQTIRDAVFKNTAGGGWRGLAEGAAGNSLRDQIMARNLNELFDRDTKSGAPPVKSRAISQIEEDIKTTMNTFAPDRGVEITTIDIRKIILPKRVREAVYMRVSSTAEAEAIERIEEQRNAARGNLVTNILNSIASLSGGSVGPTEIQLATTFARITQRALTDDILGHQYVKALERLAEGEGSKIFSLNQPEAPYHPGSAPLLGTPDSAPLLGTPDSTGHTPADD